MLCEERKTYQHFSLLRVRLLFIYFVIYLLPAISFYI